MSIEYCRPPVGLSLDGNVAENWRKFKQNFSIYMKASDHVKKEDDIKVAILLNAVGEDAIELYNTFDLTEENRNKYDKVVEAFDKHLCPKANVVVERFVFNNRIQKEHESFDAFCTDLKKLVKSCDFGDQADSVVRDRIVLGIADSGLQERLLREGDLPLSRAVEICRAAELSKIQAQTVQTKNVDAFVKRQLPSFRNSANEGAVQQNSVYLCKKCNRKHKRSECPAYGKQCFKCKNFNHFSSVCRVSTVQDVIYSPNKEEQQYFSSSDLHSDFLTAYYNEKEIQQ